MLGTGCLPEDLISRRLSLPATGDGRFESISLRRYDVDYLYISINYTMFPKYNPQTNPRIFGRCSWTSMEGLGPYVRSSHLPRRGALISEVRLSFA
jgi:hypothetical protein